MHKLLFFLDTERNINFERILSYLPSSIEVQFSSLPSLSPEEKRKKAILFASARIFGSGNENVILEGEVAFELKRFEEKRRPYGIPYDGLKIRDIYFRWFYGNLDLEKEIIVFTEDLLCTKGEDNLYHARSAIFSYPSLISLSGMNLCLARDRTFYFERYVGSKIRVSLPYNSSLPEEWFEEYLSGLILQSLFFFRIGEPFCKKKDCRLFNAHTLKEMLESQVFSKKLCRAHEELLKSF